MVDYSKWKNIEVSDDEDETHPNIHTPSLFRWRHQARIERMEQQEQDKRNLAIDKAKNEKNIKSTQEKIEKAKNSSVNLDPLLKELKKLEAEKLSLKKREEELLQKEKATPWNVDTISKPGFTKTVVNKLRDDPKQDLSEEEKEQRFKNFIKDNEKLLKEFGMLRKYEDSKRFLQEHPHLTCEDTANYLVIWCINLEMEEKHDLMEHVAHQCICIQYIMELAKHVEVDPRGCVAAFYSRMEVVDDQYKKEFEEEYQNFKARIVARAKEKLDLAIQEYEEEEKMKRLGPGGLDPVEVMETLPEALKKCFEARDVPLLRETLAKMSPEDVTYHMKRCIDSGLWVLDKETAEAMAGSGDGGYARVGPSTSEAASTSVARAQTAADSLEEIASVRGINSPTKEEGQDSA